ncbi:MAG: putative glycoside hydrolase [Gallionella sp.]|jgi:hypothetical protein
MKNYSLLILLILLTALSPVSACATVHSGTVIDAATAKLIEGAFVTLGNTVVRTDQNGKFQIDADGDTLGIRSYGHMRQTVAVSALANDAPISLNPVSPKALYLSLYGIGNKQLRESALTLIKDTELNALVIDLKGDVGAVAFKSSTPLTTEVGAQNIITIKDINSLVGDLHAKGIYLIARIVVFKDDPLASAKPDLAVKTADGAIWKDREDLAWCNPFSKTVWDYNIDLAVEAARAGFDEIQFDYVRFPDAQGMVYPMPNTEENRVGAISGFLTEARKRLIPYNVFLAADVFGYVAWNADDTLIGQKLKNLADVLDYISLMLYPSGFKFGIPGYLNPVQHPREIVSLSLEKAKHRTGLPAVRFRPWLQAFRDYAFDKRPFQDEQIRAQIDAADNFGSNGWMLWNPHNKYGNGLRSDH